MVVVGFVIAACSISLINTFGIDTFGILGDCWDY
jgi:hypothetical protein